MSVGIELFKDDKVALPILFGPRPDNRRQTYLNNSGA